MNVETDIAGAFFLTMMRPDREPSARRRQVSYEFDLQLSFPLQR
jgi:hypothetical protein